MAPRIPDRWEPYIPIGSPVQGTRFIALKVPLKEHICATLPPKLRWTINILANDYPDIGMVVDFTMTTRYYDYVDVLNKGIDYCKVAIPGQQLPSESLVKRFFAAVDSYLDRRRDDSLIGIHCTHGVNRTGYMIARYMIQRMGFSVSDAIESITVARGHPIERQNYISDLGRHLEKVPKVLDASDIHRGRAVGEPPRMSLGVKAAKKKKPVEQRTGKETVKRHGPARSDKREGDGSEWKKPRKTVNPWESGRGPQGMDEIGEPPEELFENSRNRDFRGPKVNKKPVKVWETDKNIDDDQEYFEEQQDYDEVMDERPFNRNLRGGGRGRPSRKRFPDSRGPPSHFREDRGPPHQFKEDREPPMFRDERGPPAQQFRGDRGPPPVFGEDAPNPFRGDRGPPHNFREDRGPPLNFREERGLQTPFREERGPPIPFREERGPLPQFREERGPPPQFREERGPPPQFREERGPPPQFRDDRGPPPQFREERGPPPQFREERGPPAPYREEREPPSHFRNESGPPPHFRGDGVEKRGLNRGRPDDFDREGDRGFGPSGFVAEKRFDGGSHRSQGEHWEDDGPPQSGPMGGRRGFPGRMGSPPQKRREDHYEQGPPPYRRMSPAGRQVSPPGRRVSPPRGLGRRMSPPIAFGRGMSPPSGRPLGGPPGRRMSPQGRRMSPLGKRISPQGRRMSPPHLNRMPSPDRRMAAVPFGRMSPQPQQRGFSPHLPQRGFPPPQPRMSPPRQRRMSPPHQPRMSPPRQRRLSPPRRGVSPPRQAAPRGSPPRIRGPELKRGGMRPHSRSPPPGFKPPVSHFGERGRQPSPGLERMGRSRSPGKRRSPPRIPPAKRRGSEERMAPPPKKLPQRLGPKDIPPFESGDFGTRKDSRPPGPRENPIPFGSAVGIHPLDGGRPRHDNHGPPVNIHKSPPQFGSRLDGGPSKQRDRKDFDENRLERGNIKGIVITREKPFFPVEQPFIPPRNSSPVRHRGGRSPPPHIVTDQGVLDGSRNRPQSPNRRPVQGKEFPPRHVEGDSFQPRIGRQPFRSTERSPGRKDSFKREQRPSSRSRSREDRRRSSGRSKSSNIEQGDERRRDGPSRRMECEGPGSDFPQRHPPPIIPERPRFIDQQGSIPREDRYRNVSPPSMYKNREIQRGASPPLSRGISLMKPPQDYSPRPRRSSSPGFPEITDKGWDAELEQDCRELILKKRVTSVSRSISQLSNASLTHRMDAVEDVIVIEDSSDPDHSRPPSRSRRRPASSRLSPKLERRGKSRSPRAKRVFDRLDAKKPPVFERLKDPSPRRSAPKGSPRKPRGVPRGRR